MIKINLMAIGSDHAGFEFKEKIKSLLTNLKINFIDCGTHSSEKSDYPDFAHSVSNKVSLNDCDYGILICGSGIGMSIVANKHKNIRAAVCESTKTAQLSRLHNNANILCIGERVINWEMAEKIITTFFETNFEGDRHLNRVNKIHTLTNL
ncbi:MAG: ribose 5-phosphate isomerase B [Bacteroidetes bacterium]|nr:ribose 5-phosphate isomerase B [Bacteroidota bacterium]